MRGIARRFGVHARTVRDWISRGLLEGEVRDYRNHHEVWWVNIDERTAERLETLARKTAARRRQETQLKSNTDQ